MTKRRRWAGLLAALLLTGCAVQRGVDLPDISEWDRRAAVLAGVDDFDFSGRVAVRYAADGFNGKLRWRQQGDAYHATLSGPLGIGTVSLDGSGRTVTVTDKDGVRSVLEDVEADLLARYGWTIPVDSLRYWALGIPDPRLPAETEFDAGGQLVLLRQGGWSVEIDRYREAGGGQAMPARLTAQNPQTRVRLVIDDWVFHGPQAP